jgi:hypothetical protein
MCTSWVFVATDTACISATCPGVGGCAGAHTQQRRAGRHAGGAGEQSYKPCYSIKSQMQPGQACFSLCCTPRTNILFCLCLCSRPGMRAHQLVSKRCCVDACIQAVACSAAAVLLQVGFTVAAGLMARLASVFSLFDQPMQLAARPVPPHVLQVGLKRPPSTHASRVLLDPLPCFVAIFSISDMPSAWRGCDRVLCAQCMEHCVTMLTVVLAVSVACVRSACGSWEG